MRSKLLTLTALLVAFALADAGSALADNNATGSTGAVQVSNTSVTPSVSASSGTTSVAVSAPTSVAGTGNNTSSNSVGTVQVGGGNTATG